MIHIAGVALFGSGLVLANKIMQNNKKESLPKTTKKNKHISISKKKVDMDSPSFNDTPLEDIDDELKIAGVGGGLAVMGIVFSPFFGLLSLPFLGFSSSILFKNAYQGLKMRKPRISMLDSVAAIVGVGTGHLVLSSIANIIFLVSKKVLSQTRDKTQKQIVDIFDGHTPSVWLLKDNLEKKVPLEQVKKGDRIVVNTGETVPIDGIIEEGMAGIDQHMLTGEAYPEEKTVGQKVFATTLVVSGRIIIIVEKTGIDTMAAHIAKVLLKTNNYVSTLETKGEQIANASVLPTVGLSGLALLVGSPMAMLVTLSSNFGGVITFSVPLTMLNYLHLSSDFGFLIKDGRSLEQLSKVDTVVFDKTGTLTKEQPNVGHIYPCDGYNEQDVLYYTAAAERFQTHPIAMAILDEAEKRAIELPTIDNANYTIGYGIQVNLDGLAVRVGSARYMERENISLPELFKEVENHAHKQGYSLIYTALNEVLCGVVELHPNLRPEAKNVVDELRKQGMEVFILSGDHETPVKQLAAELGVDDYIAEALPENKSKFIEELQQMGKTVCFVGDGINDAIALKKAAVSVSLQDSSHVALDSAQIILTNKNLQNLLDAFNLARKFEFHQKLTINAGTLLPSAICIGGAIFGSFTIVSSIGFYCLSLLASFGISKLTLLESPIKKEIK